jgi:4-hydroxybenzoate polyprenyltransferase/phosphoglycolate phosphatase-like HAD superfamily hydrolase
MAAVPPLAVDLDGTLIRTDLLHEALVRLMTRAPWLLPMALLKLMRGRSVLKAWLAERVEIDAAGLPYHPQLLDWLRSQHAAGRTLVLATASPRRYAEAVAAHLGLFSQVMASDAAHNLKGGNKAAALTAAFGEKGFHYAGDSRADLAVWQRAGGAVVVAPSEARVREAAAVAPVVERFVTPVRRLNVWRRSLRMHQWAKNLLVFVPLLAAQRLLVVEALLQALVAFVALSLAASATYMFNDVADLDADRQHPRKRARPFASGDVSPLVGVAGAQLLLLGSVALSLALLPQLFFWLLAGYCVVTLAYSLGLKRAPVLDVMLLALLYGWRILAGGAAAGIEVSTWLLGFSFVTFLSLALLKRYAELLPLAGQREASITTVAGRGYRAGDAPLVLALGGAMAAASVVVLAVYLSSPAVSGVYRNARVLWLTCPLFTFWMFRAWFVAHRGGMHDDPVAFALKDRVSWGVLLGLAAVAWSASR